MGNNVLSHCEPKRFTLNRCILSKSRHFRISYYFTDQQERQVVSAINKSDDLIFHMRAIKALKVKD